VALQQFIIDNAAINIGNAPEKKGNAGINRENTALNIWECSNTF